MLPVCLDHNVALIIKSFRIYYNQGTPDGLGNLKLANIYNGDSMIFSNHPLLPSATAVYKNFMGRVLYIPVVHVSIEDNFS